MSASSKSFAHSPLRVLGRSGLACLLVACQEQVEHVGGGRTLQPQEVAQVFINEFHYENAGTDGSEAVELAGPAGTDVDAYSLVLYNGANGAAYRTIPLTGQIQEDRQGYGTLVVDLPPNTLQNGAPDGLALVRGDAVLSFLSYEGTFVAQDGPAAGWSSSDILVSESDLTPEGASLARSGTGLVGADFEWVVADPASFGRLNPGQTFQNADPSQGGLDGACGDAATPIAEVQGSGPLSPLSGLEVQVEGVVVGDFQSIPGGDEQLEGFFLQSLSDDGDAATSEGIFIWEGRAEQTRGVSIGNHVRVVGTVSEEAEFTQLVARTVQDCGQTSLPTPTELPLADRDPSDPESLESDLESLEGMLVFADALHVTDLEDWGRYGELLLAAGGRLYRPEVGAFEPGSGSTRFSIVLDDGSAETFPDPVPFLKDDTTLRLGDALTHVTGVLHYGFGEYRLQPLALSEVAFERANPRPIRPPEVGGEVRVATLNVLNYFTTLGARGADTPHELERQRAKLKSAIEGLDADVLGLVEVENATEHGADAETALDELVATLNQSEHAEPYARVPEPAYVGGDAIRGALLYRPAVLEALPHSLSTTASVFERPPLAQAFAYRGQVFSVVVNHFKSKGNCPKSSTDVNADRGQGCWNARRVEQSEALLDFVAQLVAEVGDEDVVVMGDLNAYPGEEPLLTLQRGGLVDVSATLPAKDRYSYVFQGQAGLLDYVLVSPSLDVSGMAIWHINADEAPFLDYNTEQRPVSVYQPDAYRSSDHDPLLVGLGFRAASGKSWRALLTQLEWETRHALDTAHVPKNQADSLFVLLQVAENALTRWERYRLSVPTLASLDKILLEATVRSFQTGVMTAGLPEDRVLTLRRRAVELNHAAR